MKRILIFAPFAKWAPHFETDLEIIRARPDQGREVAALACDGLLPTCERNDPHV